MKKRSFMLENDEKFIELDDFTQVRFAEHYRRNRFFKVHKTFIVYITRI